MAMQSNTSVTSASVFGGNFDFKLARNFSLCCARVSMLLT